MTRKSAPNPPSRIEVRARPPLRLGMLSALLRATRLARLTGGSHDLERARFLATVVRSGVDAIEASLSKPLGLVMRATKAGQCAACAEDIALGDTIRWTPNRLAVCAACMRADK